jgi:hypothetical protein
MSFCQRFHPICQLCPKSFHVISKINKLLSGSYKSEKRSLTFAFPDNSSEFCLTSFLTKALYRID